MIQGFLDQWLICGPFFSDRGWTTLDEDYLFGEGGVAPKKGTRTFGKTWFEYDTEDNYLHFLKAPFEHIMYVTVYAHTYVYSPKDMDAVLLAGSDDGIKAWVNGRVVWRNDLNRSAVPGDDHAPIHLKAGWNSLLVKVRQGTNQWQLVAQLVGTDLAEIAGLSCAREADYKAPEAPEHAVGVRVRFKVETYELINGTFNREVDFEVGGIGSKECKDVFLELDGADAIAVGSLNPGETRTVSAKIPFGSVVSAMRGAVGVRAAETLAKPVITLSEPSRLLRDLFAPFFIPNPAKAAAPETLRGFEWSDFAKDTKGQYMLIDPPGLRHYLGGLVGRFPMNDKDLAEANATCEKLIALALDGNRDEFMRVLSSAKLSALVKVKK